MKVLGMSGALRAASTNTMLLREAARLGGLSGFEMADLALPLYDGDLEAEGIPEGVTRLGAQIAAADAVLISSPEYNKGMTPVIKNAVDWMSRLRPQPLAGKPVAVLSATAGSAGGQRAKSQLYLTLLALDARLVANPEVNLGQSHAKFDADGRLTDEAAAGFVARLVDALRAAVPSTGSVA